MALGLGLAFILVSVSGDLQDFQEGSSPGQRRPGEQRRQQHTSRSSESNASPSPVTKSRTSPVALARSRRSSGGVSADAAAPSLHSPVFPSAHALTSPPQQHALPLTPSPGGAQEEEVGVLCPELVVPDGSECLLALPTLGGPSLPRHAATLEHCVVDKTGEPLLRIVVERQLGAGLGGAQEEETDLERVTLAAWKDGYALVSAEVHVPRPGPSGRPHCLIFHPQGMAHARVEEVSGEGQARTFVLSSATGAQWQYRIHGFVQERSLTVTTAAAQLVAAVEPGNTFQFETHGVEFYKLRVAPRVDAGLITIAMLAIDRLSR